jgi:hypothetical protein
MDKTTSITTIKKEMQLQEWSAQIKAQQASGLTILEWCAENGIKPNTYYNRLKKVREKYIEKSTAIVPVSVPCSEYSAPDEHPRPSKLNSAVAENEQRRRSSCTLTS